MSEFITDPHTPNPSGSNGGSFHVDLGGIVELLSKNLYTSSNVYVRELLQNGVDAITARRGIDPEFDNYDRPKIRFIVEPRVLRVIDNGIGLNYEQAQQLLSTIGGSSKRDEFGLGRSDFLGQFGIGLLSCFLVSNDIVVYSASAAAPAIKWHGKSQGTWTVTEHEPPMLLHGCGTLVELQAIPGEPDFDMFSLSQTIEHYAAFLPVEITIERAVNGVCSGEAVTLGGQKPVWEAPITAQAAWCRENFGFEPLAAIPLDVAIAGLNGVAFVMSEGTHPGRTAKHQLYLRRMLLSKKNTDIVPEWAYFVRIVADAEFLRPTASRDALVEDSLFDETKEAIGHQIRGWINSLNEQDFLRFLSLHMAGLKALAVSDSETRELVTKWVPFETSTGRKTLDELLKSGGIRYYRTDQKYQSVLPIARANELTVLNAGYAYDQEILDQLRLDYPDQVIVEASLHDVIGVMGVLGPDQEAGFLPLMRIAQEALDGQDVSVIVRDFQPSTVPVLFLAAEEADYGSIEKAAREAEGESSLAGLLDSMDSIMPMHVVDNTAQVIFNVQSPLIHQLLAAVGMGNDVLTQAIRGLYVQSLLAGRHNMNIQARTWASEMYSTLISKLL